MKFLMTAASGRKESVNRKLLHLAAGMMTAQGHTVEEAHFSEFDMPLYHGDVNEQLGLPAGAKHFIQHMKSTDAVIFAVPEYNFSIPGTLKNLIDWVSRDKPMPWANQIILLMSASPSLVGGNRGLWQTRIPLEACGAIIHPNMFSLSSAYTAFTDDGKLKDEGLTKRLKQNLSDFIEFVKVLKNK